MRRREDVSQAKVASRSPPRNPDLIARDCVLGCYIVWLMLERLRIFFLLTWLIPISLNATDFPQAQISNDVVTVNVYLPDANEGFYRGTRFDWSGMISSVVYKGHEYFGQWFQKVDPGVRDFSYDGSEIVASPATAAVGPAEEFVGEAGQPLGYLDAKAGETFVKIGVGVLRKPDDSAYNAFRKYEVVNPGKWTVTTSSNAVTFIQELRDSASGWAYLYRKTLRVVPGKPEMVLEHSLRNLAAKDIVMDVYDHNFLRIDGEALGPDYTIIMPFQVRTDRPPEKELAEIRGNRITFTKQLESGERVFFPIQGFGNNPADYDIRIENSKVGAGLRITADRPMQRQVLWSIRAVLGVEPFIRVGAHPGEEFTWRMNYTYYLPATAAKGAR